MAPSSGLWGSLALRAAREVYKKAFSAVRTRLNPTATSRTQVQPIPLGSQNQPVHPLARIRQAKAQSHHHYSSTRWYSSAIRHFSSSASPKASYRPRLNSLTTSRTALAVGRLTSRAPFASTLRPNLTGGCLPRSAGGYSLGGSGGVRHFSHVPASQAQVVQDVALAVRGFWLAGQRAQYDGIDAKTGEKRFRTVSVLRDQARRKMANAFQNEEGKKLGSAVYFPVSPTITALGGATECLGDSEMHAALKGDFARALKDWSVVLSDLAALRQLGEGLEVSTTQDGRSLKVHFPGLDAEALERLCDEVGVRRGVVRQDDGFDEDVGARMALLFPFVDDATPSESGEELWEAQEPKALSYTTPSRAVTEVDLSVLDVGEESISLGETVGSKGEESESYVSLGKSDGEASLSFKPRSCITLSSSGIGAGEDVERYEGMSGLLRFREECERVLERVE